GIADPPAPTPLPRPLRGSVALRDVSFRYHPGAALALDGVDLEVAPGETVALVGPSGAGKTTLVSLLSRFWDPVAGTVLLDGVDVRSLRLADLRGAIGMVPQE